MTTKEETSEEYNIFLMILLKVMILARYKNGFTCALCPCLMASSILLSRNDNYDRHNQCSNVSFTCGMLRLYNSDSNIKSSYINNND